MQRAPAAPPTSRGAWSLLLQAGDALADLVRPDRALELGVGVEQLLQQLGLARIGNTLEAELALLEHPGLHRFVLVGAEEIDAGLLDPHRGAAAALAPEVVLVFTA